ncbi:hypothetical protein C8R46DRAFT_1050373 [Mycena filopes]|nr:hypothetical protein C8R46DRAFT_1050373 [Mycena filopes]
MTLLAKAISQIASCFGRFGFVTSSATLQPSPSARATSFPNRSVADTVARKGPPGLVSRLDRRRIEDHQSRRDATSVCPRKNGYAIPRDTEKEKEFQASQGLTNCHNCTTQAHPAPTFFRQIIALRGAQDKWAESRDWLPNEHKYLLEHVAWDSRHQGVPDGHLNWTRLISDEWLSGSIIDEMMCDVNSRLAEDPDLAASTFVHPLAFQCYITTFTTYSTKPKSYLNEVVAEVKGGKTRMLFPIHDNQDHWMVFIIDFARKTLGFGDSYFRTSTPRQFILDLKKWVAIEFPGEFKSLGDSLEHSIQTDYIHCGVFGTNTIEKEIFQTFDRERLSSGAYQLIPDPAFPSPDEINVAEAYPQTDIPQPSISIAELLNPDKPDTLSPEVPISDAADVANMLVDALAPVPLNGMDLDPPSAPPPGAVKSNRLLYPCTREHGWTSAGLRQFRQLRYPSASAPTGGPGIGHTGERLV